MKWFKHDSRSHDDAKLERVRSRFGADGYALYWLCLELIADSIDSSNISFELEHDAEQLGRMLKIDSIRVEEIVKYFVAQGLFEGDDGVITCYKLASRLDKATSRNPEINHIRAKLSVENEEKSDEKIGNQYRQVPTSTDKYGLSVPDKIRLDKIRLDKIRLDNESIPASANASPRAPKKKYGAFANVLLTDAEYTKAMALSLGAERIEFLSEYIERKGYKAKSHYLCICGWVADAVAEHNKKHPAVATTPPTETWQSRAEAMERRKAELKARAAVVNAQYKAGKLTLEEFWKIVEEESLHEWAE